MTDEQIVKALECCVGNYPCRECPYDNKGCEIEPDALDLINRQKAEIERLNEENEKQKIILEGIRDAVHPLPFETDYDKAIKQSKSEAVREFAQAFVSDLPPTIFTRDYVKAEVFKLLKEMAGDSE